MISSEKIKLFRSIWLVSGAHNKTLFKNKDGTVSLSGGDLPIPSLAKGLNELCHSAVLQVSLLSDVVLKMPVLNLASVNHDVGVGGNVRGDAETFVKVFSVFLLTCLSASLDKISENHLIFNGTTHNSKDQIKTCSFLQILLVE